MLHQIPGEIDVCIHDGRGGKERSGTAEVFVLRLVLGTGKYGK
jgi:hypothetical protein